MLAGSGPPRYLHQQPEADWSSRRTTSTASRAAFPRGTAHRPRQEPDRGGLELPGHDPAVHRKARRCTARCKSPPIPPTPRASQFGQYRLQNRRPGRHGHLDSDLRLSEQSQRQVPGPQRLAARIRPDQLQGHGGHLHGQPEHADPAQRRPAVRQIRTCTPTAACFPVSALGSATSPTARPTRSSASRPSTIRRASGRSAPT